MAETSSTRLAALRDVDGVLIGQVLARALLGAEVGRRASPTGNLKTMIEFGPKLRSTAVTARRSR